MYTPRDDNPGWRIVSAIEVTTVACDLGEVCRGLGRFVDGHPIEELRFQLGKGLGGSKPRDCSAGP